MPNVVFYEKPGCVGNAQQKSFLRQQGMDLQVKNLLTQLWSSADLRAFFGDEPVKNWFNLSSPRIKSGEIKVESYQEKQALKLMLEDPVLIRRPLMAVGEVRQSGFVDGPVIELLGIQLKPDQDMQSCPMQDSSVICGEP